MKKPEKEPIAIALKYDGATAPKITAKGSDALADAIIQIAEEHGVPLHNDPELSKFLATFDVGDEIPEMLYRVVAEVIAFAYIIKGKFPEGFSQE